MVQWCGISAPPLSCGRCAVDGASGHELPEGTGFDQDGSPTRDAAKALKGGVAPWGGHKGYGLSFCIQALGLIAGASLGRGVVNDYGFLFIAIDPGLTQPDNAFQRQMSELVETIKRCRNRMASRKSASHRNGRITSASVGEWRASW